MTQAVVPTENFNLRCVSSQFLRKLFYYIWWRQEIFDIFLLILDGDFM